MKVGNIHRTEATRVKLVITILMCLATVHWAIAVAGSLIWIWVEED